MPPNAFMICFITSLVLCACERVAVGVELVHVRDVGVVGVLEQLVEQRALLRADVVHHRSETGVQVVALSVDAGELGDHGNLTHERRR